MAIADEKVAQSTQDKVINRLVDRIKDIAKSTPRSGVMGEIGGFGGLFSLKPAYVYGM